MPLEERNKKILIICPHPVGYVPGQRLKYEQYFDSWRANGFDVEVSPFMSESMQQIVYQKGYIFKKIVGTIKGYLRRVGDLFRVRQYDMVYLFLWATPFGAPIMEWFICKLANKIVYDIDDLVFLRNVKHENKFLALFKGKNKPIYMMKHANHVLVSTDKLFDYVCTLNNSVSQIPATIDVGKYIYKKEGESTKVVVGWSGSHTTSKYLHLLDNVLKAIALKNNVEIMVMGDMSFAIDGVDIELLKWSAEREIEYIQKFDIGLHPMPNEEWVHGKSGGKLVQYMAAGIPIIASAIGPNFKAIKDGYNGFLVNTDDEWISKLELLITDSVLRKKMGCNSKSYAIECYSIQANLDKYLTVFRELTT